MNALTMNWGERISTAGVVSLQGMLTIFLVLIVLWGAIEIMHRVIHKEEKKPVAPVVQAAPVAQTKEEPAPQVADDGAIVAAIIAAITAARAEEGNTETFRVVSFKRAAARKRI